MSRNSKYWAAVALLAVLAVIFGLVGTAAPLPEPISPTESPSSPSLLSSSQWTHFVNPPTYDSGWLDITDKVGQSFTLTHGLNTREVLVDVVGRRNSTSEDHKMLFGSTIYFPGWTRAYGGTNHEIAFSIVQTSDRGYAVAGYTRSFGVTGYDFYLVKTDSTGNMQWNRTYGGTGTYDQAYAMTKTSDGGYVLAGRTDSYGAGHFDFWLVKTDSSGNMLWNKTYGGTNWDEARSVVQTSDGGYAVAGYTWSYGAGGFDFYLVKTDSYGNMQWNTTYGGGDHDKCTSVIQTSDGGYGMVGDGFANFVKTDPNGNKQWNKTYGGGFTSIIQTIDRGYVMAGTTSLAGAGGYDCQLVKTDSAGNKLWNRTYGGANHDYGYSVIQTTDGGYAIAGSTASYAYYDAWLIKTDASGNMLWSRTFGGGSWDDAYSVVQTNEEGYVIAGATQSFGAGLYDFMVAKADMNLGPTMGLSLTVFTNTTITLYRGKADFYWNFVRIRIWLIQEPTWQFGDINQDGVVDIKDMYIVSRNYGKTLSVASLCGITFIAGIHTYKKRKQQND